jgi:hypothetical protein
MKVSAQRMGKRVRLVPEDTAAKLIRRFLIDPFSIETSPNLADLSDSEKHSLEQVMQDVGASYDRLSQSEHRSRVVEALTDSLGSEFSNSARSEAAKVQLGAKGLLPISQYTVSFADHFDLFEGFGERRQHVQSALQNPDTIKHLSLDALGFKHNPRSSWTLFAKRIVLKSSLSFTLLVIAGRKGSHISVTAVWRLYDKFVVGNIPADPLEILEILIEIYGMSFTIANREVRKFVQYEVFALPHDLYGANLDRLIKVHRQGDEMYSMGGAAMHEAPGDKLHLWMTYALNTDRYKKDILSLKV